MYPECEVSEPLVIHQDKTLQGKFAAVDRVRFYSDLNTL